IEQAAELSSTGVVSQLEHRCELEEVFTESHPEVRRQALDCLLAACRSRPRRDVLFDALDRLGTSARVEVLRGIAQHADASEQRRLLGSPAKLTDGLAAAEILRILDPAVVARWTSRNRS